MNSRMVMGAFLLACVLFVTVLMNGCQVHATIYAYRADNKTMSFADAESSFGPGVDSEGRLGVLYLGEPLDGCSAINPPTSFNTNFTAFNFVLIARGNCDFALKVLNAQRAGYLAAIVYNVGSNVLLRMNSGLPEVVNKIYIPSLFVGEDSAKILNGSYLHDIPGGPYVELVETRFNIYDYLVPFLVVIGICFFSLLCFLCVRCMRDYRRTRRGRLSLQRLKKLPVKKFKKEDEYDVCAICLEDYEEGEVLRILPCQHAYHCKCVDPWLTSSRRVCPLCKRKVLSDDESSVSSDGSPDISDDENTPLMPSSEAASANSARYGTGFTLRNPFTNRGIFVGSTSTPRSTTEPELESNDETPRTSAQSTSRLLSGLNEYQSRELSPAHPADAEIQHIMNSGQNHRTNADEYLVSAEAAMRSRSRVSESSIAVLLSDDETEEEASPEPPTCSSTEYHTVDESIIDAQTPYNLEYRLDNTSDLGHQEDIIVIATGSTTAVQGEEEV